MAIARLRSKYRIQRSFSLKILTLGLAAGIIPLASLLVILGLFPRILLHELHQSLSDVKAREGQRLESHLGQLVHQQVRQKALDVAQEVTSYLKNHPDQTWPEIRQDPAFRERAIQPVGTVGETFLVALPDRKILLHREPAHEGQTLEKALAPQQPASGPVSLHFAGAPGLEEFFPAPGHGLDTVCRGFLVPIPLKPSLGPNLMVGAWESPGEMDLILGQTRAIFKTAFNVTGTLMEARLGRFRRYLFYILSFMGLLVLAAGMSLARRLTTQVGALARAAEAFDQGNLSYRIPNPGGDELGQLARTLNHMAAGLKENTVSRMEWENSFNVLPDPVILVDANACITRLNRAAALQFDVFPEEAAGTHVSELKSPGKDWFPYQALAQALEHGQETRMESCLGNGHCFLVSVDPCRNLKGVITGAVVVARDITDLKRMQEELSQTTHFLHQLIESAPLGLTFIDRQGRLIKANPQFQREFGYAPEDILNRHYSFLYASNTERMQMLAELREKGEVLARQVQLRQRDGQPVPARISIRKLYDKDGAVIGSVCLVSNITEETNLQRQLEQAQKQEIIATLAGGLAHNFNNLLMIIMGLTSLIMSKISPDHPAYGDLLDIERQVQAGRDITRKLLSFRRATEFETQPVNLNTLVEATADIFGRTRPELTIKKELSRKLPAVEVDPSQVQQVLMNLLINAWQAMPQGGEITLQTRAVNLPDWCDPTWELQPGPYVCLSVTDSGIGMDEETVRHLFHPFFTTKEPGRGSGLGLASAFRIMKSHRGAIQVRSKPGEGSTFTLFFPASGALPSDLAPEDKQIISGRGTILLVEDEPTLRRVAGKLLEKLGYQVLEAACGEGALEIYAQQHGDIDLVLLDLIMPGLNGMQTLARLRDLDPQVRVILCSGMEEAREETLPDGVSFIPKPIPLEILSQKVAAALNN